MKEIKYEWKFSIGYPSAIREGEGYVEVEDDASPNEIYDAMYESAKMDAYNYIDLDVTQID